MLGRWVAGCQCKHIVKSPVDSGASRVWNPFLSFLVFPSHAQDPLRVHSIRRDQPSVAPALGLRAQHAAAATQPGQGPVCGERW
jgi:hypothetical protein